jgi:hypothetical protein
VNLLQVRSSPHRSRKALLALNHGGYCWKAGYADYATIVRAQRNDAAIAQIHDVLASGGWHNEKNIVGTHPAFLDGKMLR